MSSTSPEQNNDPGAGGGGGGGSGSDGLAYPAENPNAGIPRQKRLACLICRKRKLKCDGRRPSCSTCARLGHSCAYDEVRKKSGPKRGYVKALEERLKQVEVMLKSQDGVSAANAPAGSDNTLAFSAADGTPLSGLGSAAAAASASTNSGSAVPGGSTDPAAAMGLASGSDMDTWPFNADSPPPRTNSLGDFDFGSRMTPSMADVGGSMNWELIQLNLEEPLPEPAAMNELQQIYFDKIHPSLPMVHKARFLAAMNLPGNQRPPVCLRYAMWTLASTVTDKYDGLKEIFYQRARKYLEADTLKGFGEHMLSVAHCQTHIILASYEFKMMYFPRAWMSTGQAVRLCQMIGLHRQDGQMLDVKQCIPPAQDWTEKEERRRTFWMAFCEDRYASIGTGWPMTVDERDITTHLPSSDEAFEMSRPEESLSLQEIMRPSGIGKLTPFGGIILMACMFGRNLTHLHRPDTDGRDADLNGEFWKRHRKLDNILLSTILGLPSHLKLPSGLQNPNVIFTNMCIHTSIICLHQAAIYKAEKHGLDAAISPESRIRCINAANETASIMRMVSHTDLSAMNPFVSFSLYVAARVYVQHLKSCPDESRAADSLRFLLTAMGVLKHRNPLTESFLVQLDVDLEALGERIPRYKTTFPRSYEGPGGPAVSLSGRTGAVCEDGAVDGILAYHKEFSKPRDKKASGSAATSEDSSAQEGRSGATGVMGGATGGSGSSPMAVGRGGGRAPPPTCGALAGNEQWYRQEAQLPTRDRGVGQPSLYRMPSGGGVFDGATVNALLTRQQRQTMGYVDEIHDVSSTSPGDGLSSGPTPNSSCTSESRQNLGLPPPPQGSQAQSDGSSFDTSPVSPPDGVPGAGGGGGQQGTRVDSNAGSAAYYTPGSGTSAAPAVAVAMNSTAGLGNMMGAAPTSDEYMMTQNWPMPGQQPMAQVSDGLLRTMIQMGPMETMDLGWGSNS